jgi:hypothetical protein
MGPDFDVFCAPVARPATSPPAPKWDSPAIWPFRPPPAKNPSNAHHSRNFRPGRRGVVLARLASAFEAVRAGQVSRARRKAAIDRSACWRRCPKCSCHHGGPSVTGGIALPSKRQAARARTAANCSRSTTFSSLPAAHCRAAQENGKILQAAGGR